MSEFQIQQRAVIRFLTLEGVPPLQILNRLQGVYHGETLSLTQVRFWVNETKRGRESVFDEPRSGRPKTSTTPEKIAAVEKLVMENRRIKCWEIQAETGLSRERVICILHQHLLLSTCSARWVPRNLSVFDKQRRVKCASAALTLMAEDEEKFFRCL